VDLDHQEGSKGMIQLLRLELLGRWSLVGYEVGFVGSDTLERGGQCHILRTDDQNF
jgi:hypothetical protein